jgi:hypothetical protein
MYIVKKLVFLHTERIECTTTQEMVRSDAFIEVVGLFLVVLQAQKSPLIRNIPLDMKYPEKDYHQWLHF